MPLRASSELGRESSAAAACLKIIHIVGEEMPEQSHAMRGSYADGMTGQSNAGRRGTHYVRGHYSYADDRGEYRTYAGHSEGSTLSRMMDNADPRERKVLEKLLREIDD